MKAREAHVAADEALVTFRLADRATAPVSALSGGMAQRLMVARAILHHPSVLFLDEPTAGLDPQSRLALWDILAKLREEGPTIFLSTHNMEEADERCDRIAIMDNGHLLAVDTPAGLKAAVGADSIVTVSATGDLDSLARRLESINGAVSARRADGAVQLHVKGVSGILPQVIEIAEREGNTVTDVSVSEPTLETVFINLTGRELRD